MRLDIRVGHFRPYHPQAQGKLKRFHRSLKAEVLQGKWFADSGELQRAFDHWRAVYNLKRPHEALDMAVSVICAAVQQHSAPGIRRGGDGQQRKGVSLSAGKAFREERVELKEASEEGSSEVWRYCTKVGVIDLKNGSDRPEEKVDHHG